nr:protein FAR1-related sequence 5-like [Tanacetum cinerariifolium]
MEIQYVSGDATTHICKDRCWFKKHEPVEDGFVLYKGDDHFAPVHGKGSVVLEFSSGKPITLFNVLYVPKLRKNLISDPVLNKCGYKQVYESDKYILSKSGVFLGFGNYNNGMFMLNLNKVPNDYGSVYMSSSIVVNSSLWHARLGHVHYKIMLEMSKNDLIPAIDENAKKRTTCCKPLGYKWIFKRKMKVDGTIDKFKARLVVMSFLHSNGYVHDFSTNDVTNELKALFYVHPTSFKIWRAFPHVLMIDATYKTNKYNMPFVEIVSVTSTGETFCIAFAFISEEKMDNYKWVLECLKLTLDECMLPRVIITDRDLALMNACEKVFPNATRLLCRWHISQNILKNCWQTTKVQRDWDSFLSTWKLLEDSPTWISYVDIVRGELQATSISFEKIST